MARAPAPGAALQSQHWVKQGVTSGIFAGGVCLVMLLVAALPLGGWVAQLPLRMIAALVLGPPALEPPYPLGPVTLAGIGVHLLLAALFGTLFSALLSIVPTLTRTPTRLLAAATLYGSVLWLVNIYGIAPAAGWFWFQSIGQPALLWFVHTFLFGTVLGFFLTWIAFPRARVVSAV
jgi:hypothetical protein